MKANYVQIAPTYDRGRPLLKRNEDEWANLIGQRVGPRESVDFLDVGCGTGRFAVLVANCLGYRVTAVDSSEDMLAKARTKPGGERVRWEVGNAEALPYKPASFDVVFMSHLLHHLDRPAQMIRDAYRLLRPGGVVLNRYGAMEHIRNDVIHRLFPETLPIDEARTPTTSQVEAWFQEAGLREVSSETIDHVVWDTTQGMVETVQVKCISVLTLIDEGAFQRGLERMRDYIRRYPEDPWLLKDLITLTAGRK